MAEPKSVYDRTRHGPVPMRFMDGCKWMEEEAEKRWAATWEWRKRERIDALLEEPQPKFAHLKRNYPQYIHGRAKNGNLVCYEQPGLSDFKMLMQVNLLKFRFVLRIESRHRILQIADQDELLRHYVFTTEFIWRVLDPREDGRAVSVWDMQVRAMLRVSTITCNSIELDFPRMLRQRVSSVINFK